jgi:hypothetical protein
MLLRSAQSRVSSSRSLCKAPTGTPRASLLEIYNSAHLERQGSRVRSDVRTRSSVPRAHLGANRSRRASGRGGSRHTCKRHAALVPRSITKSVGREGEGVLAGRVKRATKETRD